MSSRAAAWLAWSLFALTAVLLLAMTLLSVGQEPAFDTLLYSLLSISLAIVGALIASNQPRGTPPPGPPCGYRRVPGPRVMVAKAEAPSRTPAR